MAVIRTPPNQIINVLPHVQRFADDLEAATGAKSFGTYNGHSPPEGPAQALDIHVPVSPTTLGDAVAEWTWANRKRYGVRYQIWRQRIRNVEREAEGWRWMVDGGDLTQNHFDHNHVTFYASAPELGDPEEDFLATLSEEEKELLLDAARRAPSIDDNTKNLGSVVLHLLGAGNWEVGAQRLAQAVRLIEEMATKSGFNLQA